MLYFFLALSSFSQTNSSSQNIPPASTAGTGLSTLGPLIGPYYKAAQFYKARNSEDYVYSCLYTDSSICTDNTCSFINLDFKGPFTGCKMDTTDNAGFCRDNNFESCKLKCPDQTAYVCPPASQVSFTKKYTAPALVTPSSQNSLAVATSFSSQIPSGTSIMSLSQDSQKRTVMNCTYANSGTVSYTLGLDGETCSITNNQTLLTCNCPTGQQFISGFCQLIQSTCGNTQLLIGTNCVTCPPGSTPQQDSAVCLCNNGVLRCGQIGTQIGTGTCCDDNAICMGSSCQQCPLNSSAIGGECQCNFGGFPPNCRTHKH